MPKEIEATESSLTKVKVIYGQLENAVYVNDELAIVQKHYEQANAELFLEALRDAGLPIQIISSRSSYKGDDFPENLKDVGSGELPYDFDLHFDVKTMPDLRREVKNLEHQAKQIPEKLNFLQDLILRHRIKF
jgi:hypothetical protein